jgi:two-component system NarL family sensor kinase
VSKTLQLSRSGLQEARRSVLDLRAAPLEGRSLAQATQALVDEFGERTGVHIDFRLVGAHHPLPSRLEVGAYRIIQEALANVEKHAQAVTVTVELVITAADLRMTIVDDGRGFQPDAIPQGHYGLVGINERVYLMGGKLDLQSSPRAGTQLQVTIPLETV